MHYTSQYPSPLGELLLAADDDGLTGVWFVGQKYFARSLAPDSVAREIPLFAQVKQWLALYFAGQEPELEIPIHMVGTAFQKAVWRILRTIPYGQTMTYNYKSSSRGTLYKMTSATVKALVRNGTSLKNRSVEFVSMMADYNGGRHKVSVPSGSSTYTAQAPSSWPYVSSNGLLYGVYFHFTAVRPGGSSQAYTFYNDLFG